MIRVRRLAMAALASSKQADEADHHRGRRRSRRAGAPAGARRPGQRGAGLGVRGGAGEDDVGRPRRPRLPGALRGPSRPRPVADRRVRRLGPGVRGAVDDPSPHVALLAIDLLSGPQPQREQAIERLRREARDAARRKPSGARRPVSRQGGAQPISTGTGRRTHWCRWPGSRREAAAALLPRFEGSVHWPVRMYAARAAALLRDAECLTRLARDERDNVREAAIAGLKTVAGHDADSLYLEALGRPDYQLDHDGRKRAHRHAAAH